MEDADGNGRRRAKRAALLAALFLLHALPWLNRPAIITGDEPHYLLMAHSIALDGDIAVEADYRAVADGDVRAGMRMRGTDLDRHVIRREDGLHFSHPLGLPLLAAPWIALGRLTPLRDAPDVTVGLLGLAVTFLALLAGWDLLRTSLGNPREATLMAFAIYFTTPLWFYSRTFYTEPYQWSFLVLALWLFQRDRMMAGSFLLGWVFLLKEPGAVFVAVVLFVLLRHRGWGAAFRAALFPTLFVAAYLIKNRIQYGSMLVTFQPWEKGDVLAGIVGLITDGQSGLLTFAPILGLAAIGWILVDPRRSGWQRTSMAAGFAVAVLFLLTAAWRDWGGGTGYGPRLLVPLIPAFCFPLVLTWQRWRDRAWYRVCFLILASVGFAWQFVAASHPFNASLDISIREMVVRFPGYAFPALAAGVVISALLLRSALGTSTARPVGSATP